MLDEPEALFDALELESDEDPAHAVRAEAQTRDARARRTNSVLATCPLARRTVLDLEFEFVMSSSLVRFPSHASARLW